MVFEVKLKGNWMYADSSSGGKKWRSMVCTDDSGKWYLRKEWGKVGGSMTTDEREVKGTAKFSAKEMAYRKHEQGYTAKEKKGYCISIEDAKEAKLSEKPMLLHKYEDHKKKIKFPCYVQPKINGVRATYFDICGTEFKHTEHPKFEDNKLLSREGNPFKHADHIKRMICDYLDCELDLSYCVHMDGELASPGRHVSEVIEALKGDNKEVLKEIKLYVFDYPDVTGKLTFAERLAHGLKNNDYSKPERDRLWEQVETKIANTHSEIELYFKQAVASGQEGIIIRNAGGLYQWDERSYDVQKYKPVLSQEFKIVGMEQKEGKGPLKDFVFYCETDDGVKFKVKPAWTEAKRDEVARAVYHSGVTGVGYFKGHFEDKPATVEFREWTKYGKPFHPVLISVRDYE